MTSHFTIQLNEDTEVSAMTRRAKRKRLENTPHISRWMATIICWGRAKQKCCVCRDTNIWKKKQNGKYWDIFSNCIVNLVSYLSIFKKELMKYMTRCPVSLVFRKTQIKAVRRYPFTAVRMVFTIKTERHSVGEDKLESLYTAAGAIKWYHCYEKQCGNLPKNSP